MANPTSNFNWQMPTNTDLVKDLPADFEVFGQAVDTSLADLKGGTSGQILSKNSNTDMDFVWINNDQGDITEITASSPLTGGGSSGAITVGIQDGTTAQKGAVQLENSTSSTSTTTAAVPASVKTAYDLAGAAIPKSTVTTNGDLIYGTGSATVTRLAIGSSNQVLTVAGGVPTWATPSSGGGMTSIASGSLSGSTTTISSISGSYNNLVLFIRDYSSDDNTGDLQIRFNNDTTANYHLMAWQQCEVAASYQDGQNANTYYFTATGSAKAADNNNSLVLNVYDYATSGIRKNAEFWNSVVAGGGSNAYLFKSECGYQGTDAITRIDLLLDAGSFDGGTYVLYGVK